MSSELQNTISVISYQTKYAVQPHSVLAIDGVSVDIWLAQGLSDSQIEGLVPAQKSLDSEHDLELAWRRIKPAEKGLSTIVPLLICPDDMDFICSVIVAEQLVTESQVIWRRFGYAEDHYGDQVGASVRWTDHALQARFDKSEFSAVLSELELADLPLQADEGKRKSALLKVSYLIEAPEAMFDEELDSSKPEHWTLNRLENYLTGLDKHIGSLQLSPALKFEWRSFRRFELAPDTLNCARCQSCAEWATDMDASDPIWELGRGATLDGVFLCDDCLPKDHTWAF